MSEEVYSYKNRFFYIINFITTRTHKILLLYNVIIIYLICLNNNYCALLYFINYIERYIDRQIDIYIINLT